MIRDVAYSLAEYKKNCILAWKSYPRYADFCSYIGYWPEWAFYNRFHPDLLSREKPWIPFSAIKLLDGFIRKDHKIFEFGAGGSTIFLAKRAKEVVSVEHDADWCSKITQTLKSLGLDNCLLHYVGPESAHQAPNPSPADPNAYVSHLEFYKDKSFKAYASVIEQYPDDYFDLVLIDGRARPSCLKHAIKKVKNNGVVVLDDAERAHYSYIHQTLNNGLWGKTVLFGPKPNVFQFNMICFWKRHPK